MWIVWAELGPCVGSWTIDHVGSLGAALLQQAAVHPARRDLALVRALDDRLAVDPGDDVADLDAGLVGRAALGHAVDLEPAPGVVVGHPRGERDADPVARLAGLEVRQHLGDVLLGDRVVLALGALAVDRVLGGVHADQPGLVVEQRAARVAVVDGRGVLDRRDQRHLAADRRVVDRVVAAWVARRGRASST